jgi:class 3 adenylate cyclase
VATEVVIDRAELIAKGRAAARSGSWPEAFDALVGADASAPLDPDDLETLAEAAFFSARPEESVAARQRAFAAVRATNPRRAALIAMRIAGAQMGRGALAVGLGWAQQAKDLLADQGECDEAVWFAWLEAFAASETGQGELALAATDDVIRRAGQLGVADVEALATLLKGQLLTSQGHPEEGAGLIDPVMALAVSGCLGPFAAAFVYCGTISTCASTGDLKRAWEWTNEVGRCGVTGFSDFPGDCRMHRAELLRIRGDWAKAELEMASVCDELGSWHTPHVAVAHYELGELSLRRGDLSAATEAFAHCRELGHSPLPGMASLELASGNSEAALALALGELDTTSEPLTRAKLLPVAVESMLGTGRIDDARRAARELRDLADSWPAPLHQARAAHAEGTVAVAAGDMPKARRKLTEAVDWWRKVPAPYDEAVSRVQLALAEEPAARAMHLEAALETFVRLGAVADTRGVLGYLGRHDEVDRVTLALMFTDIEGSTTTLAELGDTAWLKVLRRHDDALRGLFGRYGGEELTGTGDGFFVGFPTADAALDCALDIQRSIEEVRVRVGVHYTEVSRDQGGLSGRGVHEAARISALGSGGDIVVSGATLERATKPYRTREIRTVGLKGLPGEMQVAYLA